jgi:transposase
MKSRDQLTNAPETSPEQTPQPEASTPTPAPPLRKALDIPPEVRQEIVRLQAFYGTRQISSRVQLTRKVVRRVLAEEGCLGGPKEANSSKLTRFFDAIEERVLKGLTVSRTLREIRKLGYHGGRTILAEHVRELRKKHALALPGKQVKRRFETGPGREMQTDWSAYNVTIAQKTVRVHVLSVLLCHCRKLWVGFFRDERQHTLLEGLACAFEYFDGCAVDLVLDNMATAVLGRFGPDRKPIWNPPFAQFAKHYGFNALACAVRDPDRKGKDEKAFRLIEDDFIKGSKFDSWEHLIAEGSQWLDHTPDTSNLRDHGTTGEQPNEAYLAEREFLIRLPHERFPVHEDSIRSVDTDSTLSIFSRRYTIPAFLANRAVLVRLFAHHFEVLDPQGRVAFSRTYAGPEESRRLLIDQTHYASLPRRACKGGGQERLDEAFLRRFPQLTAMVDGLKVRMKTLAPIHLRALLRLTEQYGEEAFVTATMRAQSFRRFDAQAVARILEQDCPEPPHEPVVPLTGDGSGVLGDVDSGTLEGFGHLDDTPPMEAKDANLPHDDGPNEEDTHGS